MTELKTVVADLPSFDRHFWNGAFHFTKIGTGALGGKASGLAFAKDMLARGIDASAFPDIDINIPTMAVLATDCFDEFIAQNRLGELRVEELPDDHIARAFQQADLPVERLGDLRALIEQVKTPLAIRSSSLLEDALNRPFAGVYGTKMIPNNQFDPDTRFRRLVEAIKFVYASTYFREARDYIKTTGHHPSEEKMAVIIQEVVGRRHGDRFYPDLSGVARSYNFYPTGPALPEEGVASLALGLGKTIVDGGVAWTFSPAYPKKPPPFGSVQELLRGSQTEFWAVNMGKPPAYDPVSETEYLVTAGLKAAEDELGANVEIEFAVTIQESRDQPTRVRLGFLQVRPMVVSEQIVNVSAEDLSDPRAIIASDMVMGNGIAEDIQDIVFVRPEHFSPMQTLVIAQQLELINRQLSDQHKPFLLIGFGRWGSSHPSLGIPVVWSQISGARAIVEATLPEMNIELSQGSHFFHNLSRFRTCYFMVRHDGPFAINWDWLNRQPIVQETELVRHVRTAGALTVCVDGRSRRGVVLSARRTQAGEKEK